MSRKREPQAREVYAGASDIAEWFGVNRAAVSNWFARFADYPQPDVRIGSGRARAYGWLPSRRPEWEAWHAATIGKGGRLNDLSGWAQIATWQETREPQE